MRKEAKDWIVSIGIAIVVVLIVNWLIITPYTVQGRSMAPTFEQGDKVLVSKLSKTFSRIQEGDVIVFHEDDQRDFIKRVIGKPGDTVSYQKDQLYVNGKKVAEPYLKENKERRKSEFLTENFNVTDIEGAKENKQIPESRYLVLGDNRLNSMDSRNPNVGFVNEDEIVGEVVMRFWPFNRIAFQFHPDTFDKVNES